MSLKDISLLSLFQKLNEALSLEDLIIKKDDSFLKLELNHFAVDLVETTDCKLKSYLDVYTPIHHDSFKAIFGENTQLYLGQEFSGDFFPKAALMDEFGEVFNILGTDNSKDLFVFEQDDLEYRLFVVVSDDSGQTIAPACALDLGFPELAHNLMSKQEAILTYQKRNDLMSCFSKQEVAVVQGLYSQIADQILNKHSPISGEFYSDTLDSCDEGMVKIKGRLGFTLESEEAITSPYIDLTVSTDTYGNLKLESFTFANESWSVSNDHSTYSPQTLTLLLQKLHTLSLDFKSIIENGFAAEDIISINELANSSETEK